MRHFASTLVTALVFVCTACGPQVPKTLETDFKMNEDSLSFPNFGVGYDDAVLTPETMQRMFGAQVCRPGSSPCELTLAAQGFLEKTNLAMLGGRCEGMSLTASLLKSGKISSSTFGAAHARELKIDGNTALQREIAYWFATQLHPSVVEKTKAYLAKDFIAALATALKDPKERYRIGIVRKRGTSISGGHTLTPIAYYAEGNGGVYNVRVYDSNDPDREHALKVDTKNNTWEYVPWTATGRTPATYFGDAANKNPLYLAPILSRTGELACFFCDGKSQQVTTSGGAQVAVTSGGTTSGVVDGEMQGSTTPQFSVENDGEGASFITNVGAGDLSMSVVASEEAPGDEPQGVTVQGQSFIARVEADATQGSSSLGVTNGGRDISFHNSSGGDVSVSSAVDNNGTTVKVEASVSGGSGSVSTSVDSMGTVTVKTEDASGSTVTVGVEVSQPDGGVHAGTLEYESNGTSELGTNTNTLAMNGTIEGTVNNNGTMEPVTNACLDGKLSGMESDVDCGRMCEAKCATGKKCSASTDCASGSCNTATGFCVATACEDGQKSSGETDVDCGGSSCGACAIGKTCGVTADCSGTAVCAASKCTQSYALSVSVSGLPALNSLALTNSTTGDVLAFSANSTQTFPTRITGAYAVSISSAPFGAQCTLTGGTGTATMDVTLAVTCAPTFAVGGIVSGLSSGKSVTLRNNGASDLTISANGAFAFSTRVLAGYAVTVFTNPSGANCAVTNGSGIATSDVGNVVVTCVDGYSIGGSVSGFTAGETMTLANGADTVTITGNGAFTFPVLALSYSATIQKQPLHGRCSISNATGTASAPVTNIIVSCLASGILDLTFNGPGWFTNAPSSMHNEWWKVAVNPDDSTVWAGRDEQATFDDDWVVCKLAPNGGFDATFGTGGLLRIARGNDFNERATAITRLSNGSYLVAGSLRFTNNSDFAVARVTSNGALDTTFGNLGIGSITRAGNDILRDMYVYPDESMLLVGQLDIGGIEDLAIAKMLPDAGLDPTFGTNGMAILSSPNNDVAQAVDVNLDSGSIYVAGFSGPDALLLKYNPNGTLDPSFGDGGVYLTDHSGTGGTDVFYDVHAGQNITAVGQVAGPGNLDGLWVQVTPTGQLTSFGGTGRILEDLGGQDRFTSIYQLPDQSFLVTGARDAKFPVVNRSASGARIDRFGTDGGVLFTLGTGGAWNDIRLDNQGRIVVGGNISTGVNPDFGAARLIP